MRRLLFPAVIAAFLLSTASLFADDTLPGLKSDRFSLSGYGSFINTRVASYKYHGDNEPSMWFSNVVINLMANVALGEHFTGHLGIEGYTFTNTVPANSQFFAQTDKQMSYWTMYPHQIEGVYSFGDNKTFGGEIGGGLFPYKYNHDAWNLGEYLFRSGTYPGYLITNFDQAWTRLSGLRVSLMAFGVWHNDFLLTKELQYPPFGDATLSWISDLPLANIIDIGAGVSLSHYLSVDNSMTTPHVTEEGHSTISKISSDSTDTTWYTFRGIKVMGRLSIDPKGILNRLGTHEAASIFGDEDLKIYGEATILGLQNQDTLYSKLWERIPVMVGFNFPAFGILNVISLQLEYYGSPYPDDYRNIYPTESYPGLPLPVMTAPGTYTMDDYRHDNWKWSVYANKFFGKNKRFGIIAQAARDHWRTTTTFDVARDYEEALTTGKQWYWATKAVFIF